MAHSPSIEFWFEFGSTYSYPAAMRIETLASKLGVEVVWRAFLLGPIFRDQGWTDSPFNLYRAKGRYMWRDLERICNAYGIGFRRPSDFPRDGLLAARVACRFADAPWIPSFVRAVYVANFHEDLDIANPTTVATCLASSGHDPEAIIAEGPITGVKTGTPQTNGARCGTKHFRRPLVCRESRVILGK